MSQRHVMSDMAPRARNALALYVQTHAPTILAALASTQEYDPNAAADAAIDLTERLFFKQVERYKEFLP